MALMANTFVLQVRSDELSRVTRGDLCRINNSLDMIRSPFPPVVVVERALLMVLFSFIFEVGAIRSVE